ncbi:MAG: hypothetical protein JWM16_5772 [Verrucomicrobiales bacterium]|nr:hypothetical protein [Verrucomicrobiales bacterium]
MVVWGTAIFTATVLSGVVAFLGWVFSSSSLPPIGGGAPLSIIPAAGVWILCLGTAGLHTNFRRRRSSSGVRKGILAGSFYGLVIVALLCAFDLFAPNGEPMLIPPQSGLDVIVLQMWSNFLVFVGVGTPVFIIVATYPSKEDQ